VIVTLDDDLQNPPEEIPQLLERLAVGDADVVYGVPQERRHSWSRNWGSRLIRGVLRLLVGREVARWVSSFRAFRTALRDGFASFDAPFVAIDVLLSWSTTRFAAVPVRHEPRRVGRSQYTLRRLLRFAIDMLTGFSTLPLRLASLFGFAITLFGVLVLGSVLLRYWLQGCEVAGFPFLASIIAIFSGTQMFALGVMGEYLARIFSRSMGRPGYLVRRTTAAEAAEHRAA
jgi:undecaprenyl-phosphate 4-deoxy-4-formamido-L-arabinose transferase